jgi:hypothetical protein
MKTLALLVSLGLVGAVATAAPQSKETTATEKTHQVTGEVISVDSAKNTLTIKGSDGMEKTATAEGSAIPQLKSLKTGEKVTLTCRDNEKGEHVKVTSIQVNKPM